MTSRSTLTVSEIVERLGTAFNDHDLRAIMALISPDCVFEDTTPPDGHRHVGADDVRRAWEELFTTTTDGHFSTEETVATDTRAAVRWRYEWTNPDGSTGHVRGIDLYRIEAGLIHEKRSYVKG